MSSGISSQWDGDRHYSSILIHDDLTKHPLREYFFQALPLTVHPIIILRLLCHKMFGNMLRRKSQFSANNLVPPVVVETDSCPPRPPSQTDDSRDNAASKKRRANLHVQISTPERVDTDTEEDEAIRIKRRRTRRAGSMDKHLMRFSSVKRRSGNALAMGLAIKAIGDSLMHPLDLNVSQGSEMDALDQFDLDDKPKRNNPFRLPNLRRRSKSQGYIAGFKEVIEDPQTSQLSLKSSGQSLNKNYELEVKELQRELINLPTYEIDTHHRLDAPHSPLLMSRSSSVPDLEPRASSEVISRDTGADLQSVVTGSTLVEEMPVDAETSQRPVCEISITAHAVESDTSGMAKNNSAIDTLLSNDPEGQSLSQEQQQHLLQPSKCSPTSADSTTNDSASTMSPPTSDVTPIIFKFAAATPCESPASYSDHLENEQTAFGLVTTFGETDSMPVTQLIEHPPQFPNQCLQTVPMSRSAEVIHQAVAALHNTSNPDLAIEIQVGKLPAMRHQSHSLDETCLDLGKSSGSHKGRPMSLLSVSCQENSSMATSHDNLNLSPSGSVHSDLKSPNFSLMVPSPGLEVPLQHRAIMKVGTCATYSSHYNLLIHITTVGY